MTWHDLSIASDASPETILATATTWQVYHTHRLAYCYASGWVDVDERWTSWRETVVNNTLANDTGDVEADWQRFRSGKCVTLPIPPDASAETILATATTWKVYDTHCMSYTRALHTLVSVPGWRDVDQRWRLWRDGNNSGDPESDWQRFRGKKSYKLPSSSTAPLSAPTLPRISVKPAPSPDASSGFLQGVRISALEKKLDTLSDLVAAMAALSKEQHAQVLDEVNSSRQLIPQAQVKISQAVGAIPESIDKVGKAVEAMTIAADDKQDALDALHKIIQCLLNAVQQFVPDVHQRFNTVLSAIGDIGSVKDVHQAVGLHTEAVRALGEVVCSQAGTIITHNNGMFQRLSDKRTREQREADEEAQDRLPLALSPSRTRADLVTPPAKKQMKKKGGRPRKNFWPADPQAPCCACVHGCNAAENCRCLHNEDGCPKDADGHCRCKPRSHCHSADPQEKARVVVDWNRTSRPPQRFTL